jgi:tetratricopeptide (TPR) repeat protein
MARAQHNRGVALSWLGDFARAETCLQRAMALYEQTQARLYRAIAAMDLGTVYLRDEQAEQAESIFCWALEVMQKVDYSWGIALVLTNLGRACIQQGKYVQAEDFSRRAATHWHRLNQPISEANAKDNLAEAYLKQGKWQAALEPLTQALDLLNRLEATPRNENLRHEIEEHIYQAKASLRQDSI